MDTIVLETPETMKLFGIAKNIIDKTKNGENVPRLEVAGVFLVQCNLIHNRYQQKTDALYIFMSNKCYGYMLNVDWCNLKSFENI